MKYMAAAAIGMLLLLGGCGPSSVITSSWKANTIPPHPFNKIVVLGLIRDADRSLREKMEQHLVGDLKNMGYNAVCSCDEFNPKAFENLSEDQAMAKLKNSGADAMMTIVLLDKSKERYYVPGQVYYSPYAYYNRFWHYSRMMYDRIYTSGYYAVDTKYFWETNLYDLNSNQLIYSAQSQSFNPVNAESMGHNYGMMITKDLAKNGVLVTNQVEKKPM